MVWIEVLNDNLSSFKYAEYGMEKTVEVSDNGTANVPKDVAEELFEHPSGDFVPYEQEESGEEIEERAKDSEILSEELTE